MKAGNDGIAAKLCLSPGRRRGRRFAACNGVGAWRQRRRPKQRHGLAGLSGRDRHFHCFHDRHAPQEELGGPYLGGAPLTQQAADPRLKVEDIVVA